MPPAVVHQLPTPSTISGGPVGASSEHEMVKQLVALLRSELEGSGQLGAIKAQLASTASNLVLSKSSSSLKSSASKIPEPTLSILAECLAHYGFRHSLNTLLAESGVSRDRLITRPQLAKHIGVADVDGKESGSLVEILTKRASTTLTTATTSSAPTSEAAPASNPISSSIRTPPPALAPLRTAGGPSPVPSTAAPPAVPALATAATSAPPPTSSPPTQHSTLASAAATRPHTAPPHTPLPPTPPKVSAKDIVPPQPASLAPLAHPVAVRSHVLDTEPRSIGASPQSPGALDLSQLSSIPSHITSEDLGLSGESSPASTSVLSTEDYSVSVSLAQAGGTGGEFRGLGLERKGQVGAWLADKEFHMKP